jgi:hypothetical protein
MSAIAWLPGLILLEAFQGNWEDYFKEIYRVFVQDFIDAAPSFRGQKLRLKRYPIYNGKEATFWHLISEGKVEEERVPDLRRCERIRWPKPTIQNEADNHCKVWENERKGEKRILIWLEQENYIVVLAQRNGYFLPWTAFLITYEHQKRKYQKEYEAFKKTSAAD